MCAFRQLEGKILVRIDEGAKANQLTAAARSSCPPTIAGFCTDPGLFEAVGVGLLAVGIGGLAAPGLAPTAGGLGAAGFPATGEGLGLDATGGGTLPAAGAGFAAFEAGALGFFHGVADPFAGAIPGNTDTGFADASAVTGVAATLGVGVGAGRVLGGGGGAAGAALGGTSSR